MQVDHVSLSPGGGAGSVATQLVKTQVSIGIDAKLHTILDKDLWRQPTKSWPATLAAAADNFVIANRSQETLGSLIRSRISRRNRISFRKNSVIHLHWIEGVCTVEDLSDLAAEGRKLVWTLHDMRAFTGFCHQSSTCMQFTESCQACPQAHGLFRGMVKRDLFIREKKMPKPELIRLVVPSVWMLNMVRDSKLFREYETVHIPNPISDAYLHGKNRQEARALLQIPEHVFVGMSIAAQLDSKGKNILESVQSFLAEADRADVDAVYLLIGEAGNLDIRDPRVIMLGRMNPYEIADVARAADVLITMSKAESSGLTVVEAGALAVPSLVSGVGGLRELVRDKETGYVTSDFGQLSKRLSELFLNPLPLRKLGEAARAQSLKDHSPLTVARKYAEVYL